MDHSVEDLVYSLWWIWICSARKFIEFDWVVFGCWLRCALLFRSLCDYVDSTWSLWHMGDFLYFLYWLLYMYLGLWVSGSFVFAGLSYLFLGYFELSFTKVSCLISKSRFHLPLVRTIITIACLSCSCMYYKFFKIYQPFYVCDFLGE